MRTRPLALVLVSLAALSLLVGVARAQGGHRRTPPPTARPIPMAGTVIDWSVFISAYAELSSSRATIPDAATPVALPPATGWSCSVGTPTRAAVDTEHWSEVRTLECRRGDAILSTTGFCQVVGTSWGARAAVLSLGSTGAEERIQVTVDCAVRN